LNVGVGTALGVRGTRVPVEGVGRSFPQAESRKDAIRSRYPKLRYGFIFSLIGTEDFKIIILPRDRC
jgi:hypothetical protein